MEIEFVKYLASLGVGGLIAGLLFMFYRRDVKEYTAQWQGQSQTLVQIVKENTEAITANTLTIQSLHRRDDELRQALMEAGLKLTFRSGDERRGQGPGM